MIFGIKIETKNFYLEKFFLDDVTFGIWDKGEAEVHLGSSGAVGTAIIICFVCVNNCERLIYQIVVLYDEPHKSAPEKICTHSSNFPLRSPTIREARLAKLNTRSVSLTVYWVVKKQNETCLFFVKMCTIQLYSREGTLILLFKKIFVTGWYFQVSLRTFFGV